MSKDRIRTLESQCAAMAMALDAIASCEFRVDGDVVDIARRALLPLPPAPWRELIEACREWRNNVHDGALPTFEWARIVDRLDAAIRAALGGE